MAFFNVKQLSIESLDKVDSSLIKRFFVQLGINILIIVFVFVFSLITHKEFNQAGLSGYFRYALFYYGLHFIVSLAFQKYERHFRQKPRNLLSRYFYSWLFSTGISLLLIYLFQLGFLSRHIVLFNFFGLFVAELFFLGILVAFRKSVNYTNGAGLLVIDQEPESVAIEKRQSVDDYESRSILDMAEELLVELGEDEERLRFIGAFFDEEPGRALLLKTSNIINILNQPKNHWSKIVNLQRLNIVRYVNKFLEALNSRLPINGLMAVSVETKNIRKERILKKLPPVINYIYYTFDYLFTRVLPKVPIGKKIYFGITKGRNRVMSRSEILGRLISCGFQIIAEEKINKKLVVIARKVSEPTFNKEATYGPFIHLNRIGKDGRLFKVYKFRTMHPYSEYLQEYIYKNNNLNEGGKIKDDYRINSIGSIMRKLWIDELPMLINVFKGELKIVGVRPLSKHYFGLYTPEMQKMRIKTKPGLIPPFYVDLPKTLPEIQESERRYLESYFKSPIITDIKYFFKALYNILIKHARSN